MLVLFVLSFAAIAVFVLEIGPPWLGEAALGGTLGLIAAWWLITGFSGFVQHAGRRILRRPGETGPPIWPIVVCLGLAAAAIVALDYGARSASVAIVVALASGSGIMLILRGRDLRSGPPMWPILVCVGIAAVGIVALDYGARSALVAIAVALAAGGAMVLILARRFAVFATLSIVGIAIGVAALIVVQSVATGFQHEFERRVLGVYAHINVTRAFGISEYRRFESYLRDLDGVIGASPFVYYAMALAPHDPTGGKEGQRAGDVRRASVLVKGVEPTTADEVIDVQQHLEHADPEAEVTVADLSSDVVLQPIRDREDDRLPPVIADTPDPRGEGWFTRALSRYRKQPDHLKYGRRRAADPFDDDAWPDEDDVVSAELDPDTLPTMFVGVTLARELSLSVDDLVMLVDPGATFDHSEAPAFRYYRVAGIFRAGFQEYDSRLIYVHIKELQYFKYRGKDTVSGIDLRLADPYDAPKVESVLRRTIGDEEYSILEWQKLNANLFQSIRTQKSILTVILSLVSAVAGFNVLAALWTMVVRRTPEVAIMMSMGSTESGVGRIFQFSGMMIGAVGSIAGVGFGLVLCGLVELYGYTLDPEVYFIERLPVEISSMQVTAVLMLTMVISFVATIPPALRAAKLRPVDGLRFE